MPNHIELLDLLLENRGILQKDRERFLNPSYEDHIYDPFLMKDMERVCVRIFEATEAKEKILIYSGFRYTYSSQNEEYTITQQPNTSAK